MRVSRLVCLCSLKDAMYYKTLFREGLLHTDTAWDDLPGYYQTAWNLIETAQQKSHPLEGSSQEAIPLPSTTFDFFSVVFYLAHSTPPLAIADASVFSFPWRRRPCAAPVTHQDQGLVTSRFVARRLPLASWLPQKTLGSLPCPSCTAYR